MRCPQGIEQERSRGEASRLCAIWTSLRNQRCRLSCGVLGAPLKSPSRLYRAERTGCEAWWVGSAGSVNIVWTGELRSYLVRECKCCASIHEGPSKEEPCLNRACSIDCQSADQLALLQEAPVEPDRAGGQTLLHVKTAIINGTLARYTGRISLCIVRHSPPSFLRSRFKCG